jgi:hypothetical protein
MPRTKDSIILSCAASRPSPVVANIVTYVSARHDTSQILKLALFTSAGVKSAATRVASRTRHFASGEYYTAAVNLTVLVSNVFTTLSAAV